MNNTARFSLIMLGATAGGITLPLNAADIPVPAGFEDIFNARIHTIVDIVYNDHSIGAASIEYDTQSVYIISPTAIADKLLAADMPQLTLSRAALVRALAAPLKRVRNKSFADEQIVASLDESNSALRLLLPAFLYKSGKAGYANTYITQRPQAGFVHSHNINYLSDSWGDSLSFMANDTLNLNGNSYLKGIWSYARNVNIALDELALYYEVENNRIKVGRQRLNDNYVDSTPSMSYSFFNTVNFDGASMGYMADRYIDPGNGAASPVSVYLPQAATVEVYRSGRLIDLQQFPAGLQYLNTDSWPAGGYDVQLISKLVNGSQEEKRQPFFKRNGNFRSGDIEYLFQLGRYDQQKSELSSRNRRSNCHNCQRTPWETDVSNNTLISLSAGYTTQSALSFGGGTLMDNERMYGNSSLNIPINSWLIEQIHADGIYGDGGSNGYQISLNKSYGWMGINASYRDNRYRGERKDYRKFGIVPRYDFDYMQLSANTFLFWNLGLGVNFGINNFYQDYGHQNKTSYKNWDINLNRDFNLSNTLNLRVDLGYHHGINTLSGRNSLNSTNDDRLFAQFTLGMHERSYNHYQSLYLRTRMNDSGRDKNIYSADYALNLDNPEFDHGGKYILNTTLSHGPNSENNSSAGLVVDNRLGYNAFGVSQSFGNSHYSQYYLSQRSGFAIGDGTAAWGRLDSSAALIVDATDLPADQYFETSNQNAEPVVVKGGQKTTLAVPAYQKVAPRTEQVFTGNTNAFYNLKVQAPSTWIMPGQVYQVKLSATKNLTVTGRLYANNQPLTNARVIGGNTLSDEEGLFIGDFTLKTTEKLTSLTVKKEGQSYLCPFSEHDVKMTQGIMQIREVNCEAQ